MFNFLPLAMVLPVPASAQQVQPCESGGIFPYETTALAIAEPWEDNTRSFADGQLRLTVMDIYEPALGALYLMVIFEPLGGTADLRNCVLISNGTLGFPDMTLEGLEVGATEGPEALFLVPTTFYNPTEDALEHGMLKVVIDRQMMTVTAARL